MAKKIILTLTDREWELVQAESERMGMQGVSAYAKYMLLQGIPQGEESIPLPELLQEMERSLNNLSSGQTFIISALIEPSTWRKLDRGQKNTLAQQLRSIVKANPDVYCRLEDTMPDRTRIYKKVDGGEAT